MLHSFRTTGVLKPAWVVLRNSRERVIEVTVRGTSTPADLVTSLAGKQLRRTRMACSKPLAKLHTCALGVCMCGIHARD